MIELWAQVTEIPEERRIIVFSIGIENGFRWVVIDGGHISPISVVGDSLLWKKAQKKAKKNITSEAINKIILNFKPDIIVFVW